MDRYCRAFNLYLLIFHGVKSLKPLTWLSLLGSYFTLMCMKTSERLLMQLLRKMRLLMSTVFLYWQLKIDILNLMFLSKVYLYFRGVYGDLILFSGFCQSHAGKVVERHWYEKNKHIFPASRWEVFVCFSHCVLTMN